jgi:hypothetical protein
MSFFWHVFVEEGEKLYNYLINNYNKMLDKDNIPHFYIRNWYYYIEDIDNIYESYGEDIEKELLTWIQNEYKENRLFNRELWKPFRGNHTSYEMFNGYRKLFQYKHYYFQLGIEPRCENDDDKCIYCIDYSNRSRVQIIPHFYLALYGWKKDNSDMLQPYEKVKIPLDNIMPERDWKLK